MIEKILFIIALIAFFISWVGNYNPNKGWLILWELKKALNRDSKNRNSANKNQINKSIKLNRKSKEK
ncbi:hypothetical protein [Tenacibaculum finnmarkense]|uniref:hypothetical protein n=1 Tax=Tenacibaculum finnmarkense TaxID=2781243 RepID=UPI001EFA3782|nr:hypothetical protein [Tenacibaculum finnmarkense]MCG8226390.1 hypothetical protein [Tenacibaculum finnmarkense genomovar finnmarkense]